MDCGKSLPVTTTCSLKSFRCVWRFNGAELILAPYATAYRRFRGRNFLSTLALENGVYFAACNHVWARRRVGHVGARGMVIDPAGEDYEAG